MGGIFGLQQDFSTRAYNMVVLCLDYILQENSARSPFTLDIGVERQVQGNYLYSCIGLSGIIERIAGENVGTGTGLESLVCRISRKVFLELPYTGDILHKLVGMGLVLQEDERFVRALDTQQLVICSLVGAYHQVHLAVVHVQPGQRTLIIIVCPEGIGLAEEILGHAGLYGNICSGLQVIPYLFDVAAVSVVIPDRFKGTVCGTAHQRIGTVLVRVVPGGKFLRSHICRIESSSGRAVFVALDERFARSTVPGAVVNLRESLLHGVSNALQKGLLVPKILFPVNCVHLVGRKAVKVQDFFSVVRYAAEVRSLYVNHGIIVHIAFERRLGLFT